MTLAEAERRARSNLYHLAENVELLESKKSVVDKVREHGSRVEQKYEEKPGNVSHHYEGAVPGWFLTLEEAEWAVYELQCAVVTVRHLLEYLEKYKPELFALYAMKYRDMASLPELKRRFGRKLKRLDQDLVFELIHWTEWKIYRDGGEVYEVWLRKN